MLCTPYMHVHMHRNALMCVITQWECTAATQPLHHGMSMRVSRSCMSLDSVGFRAAERVPRRELASCGLRAVSAHACMGPCAHGSWIRRHLGACMLALPRCLAHLFNLSMSFVSLSTVRLAAWY